MPQALASTLTFMERTADVPAADRLSSKSLFRKSVDQITLRLEDGSEPPKKEIPHPLLLIVALELFRGFRICAPASSEHLLGPSFSNFGPRPAAMIWRGGLPGTGSGIRERCARLELCFVASWSDARLMHLELACSDSAVSRLCLGCYLLGRLPPGALSRLAGVFLFSHPPAL